VRVAILLMFTAWEGARVQSMGKEQLKGRKGNTKKTKEEEGVMEDTRSTYE
jgi:hypothetical protein